MLKNIMIKKFTSGICKDCFLKRVIFQTFKTFTEAEQYVQCSEATVWVARGHSVQPYTLVNAINFSNRNLRGPRGR